MHGAGDLGDHIGMESCVDLETDTESAVLLSSGRDVNRKAWGMMSSRRSGIGRNGRELPPTLPMTVMKRYYTDDGRLIITEERMRSPVKYEFKAHRSHGRLTLQLLVPSDSSCDVDRTCENDVPMVGVGDAGVRVGVGTCLFVNQNQLPAITPLQIM